ncbi:MAG: hypothetical protein JJ863_34865 [Deltaproteobacteria bacterium]|nr:hypothetical protein [Deltaproteobacteria bacterium]
MVKAEATGPVLVHDTVFHRVERHDGFLKMVRSAEPYPDLAAIDSEYGALVAALSPYEDQQVGLLVDLRDARGRNDPGFEETQGRWRKRCLQGHEPLVVLVKSALGRMHVERHMKVDGLHALVTTDVTEALQVVGQRISGVVRQDLP